MSTDYEPNNYVKGLKAVFLNAIRDLPPEKEYTQARIEQLCPGINLNPYWPLPGFKEWFTNTAEYEQMKELSKMIALETAIEVMQDKGEKGQARVTAAKLCMEINGENSHKNKEASKYPKLLEGMSKEQLREFLSQNVIHLNKEKK